jgi:hypothetical protein
MNVNKVLTKDYENKSNWAICENKPNIKPKQTQFQSQKMLLSMTINTRLLLRIPALAGMKEVDLISFEGQISRKRKPDFMIDWLGVCAFEINDCSEDVGFQIGVTVTKHNKYNLAAIFLLFALLCLPCLAKEYHIDSQTQFDALSTTVFLPGDTILFKRGVQFNGMFAPSGIDSGLVRHA